MCSDDGNDGDRFGPEAAGERAIPPPSDARPSLPSRDDGAWDLQQDLRAEIEKLAAERGVDPAWLADTLLRRAIARLPSILQTGRKGGPE
jgi:hypothetical protein